MNIRPSDHNDLNDIFTIHTRAFGNEKGAEIAALVRDLMNDPTAEPRLSLVASDKTGAIGHILFTRVTIPGAKEPVSARILAPLAVLPEQQNNGTGQRLIKEGLYLLKEAEVDLVFVLGHPGYYPKSGFIPAGRQGLTAPYPIPEKDADAWMVQVLSSRAAAKKIKGQIRCADSLNQPQHWRE